MKFLLSIIMLLNTTFCLPIEHKDISTELQDQVVQSQIIETHTCEDEDCSHNMFNNRGEKPNRTASYPSSTTDFSVAPTEFRTYLEAYYRGLVCNFGENTHGSCGYIAVELLLNYYDSYYNDNIIPEQYDVASTEKRVGESYDKYNMIERGNSPGTRNDKIEDHENLTYLEYLEEMQSIEGSSFHAKLIGIGNDPTLNYNQYTQEEMNTSWYCLELLPGITHSESVVILDKYLESNTFTQDKYTIRSYSGTSEEVENFVKQEIAKGNPVMTSISKSKVDQNGNITYTGNHGFVCYAYDENYVYAHKGWTGAPWITYELIERDSGLGYDTYHQATVIDFSFRKTQSYNYEVEENGEITKYCYSDCRILTYKPTHSHNNIIIDSLTDSTGHYDTCTRCSQVVFHSAHSYVVDDYSFVCDSTGHRYDCAICDGYPIYEEHEWMSNYEEYYEDGHYGVCLTSMQLVWKSDHIYEYAYTEGGYNYYYCYCGEYYSSPI